MPKAVSLCRILVAATVLATAACDESPTGVRNPAMRPSFDTGFGFGSGNRAQNDSSTTTEAVASADATASTTTCVSGFGFGSGNVTAPPPCTAPGN